MSRPIKVTPEVLAELRQRRELGLTYREAAAPLGITAETARKALTGRHANVFIPAGKSVCSHSTEAVHTDAAPQEKNGPEAALKEVGPDAVERAEADPLTEPNQQEDETMLLQNQSLTPDARKHFGLPRSPFTDDVQSPDDVFQSPSVRYVRAALNDCANHHGFIAVVGESGAGKSTLAEDLEERIKAEGREVMLIRPYVLAMEQNDAKGKTLKSSHIAEAIAAALDPQLGLGDRLTSQNAEVREVMQRCEIVELEPLDGELEAYLRHKFARFDLKYEDVFAADAADAIRARLIHMPRGGRPQDARSICHPLVVNNLVCRAMNAAARAGWAQVDAQVIAGC